MGDFAGTVTLLVESQEEGYLAQVLVSIEASSAADLQKAPERSGLGTGGPWHCVKGIGQGLQWPDRVQRCIVVLVLPSPSLMVFLMYAQLSLDQAITAGAIAASAMPQPLR